MGDKDTDKLFGKTELLIGGELKTLPIIKDSIELDKMSVREEMLDRPLKVEPLSFDFQMPVDDSLASFLGADLASEPSKQVCSLVITSEPKINKPKNLKYPNKKRARRIWKKWKRRFGTTPGKMMYLPNVEIESEMANEHYGYPWWRIKAKPIKND